MYHLVIAGSGGGKSSLFNAVFGPIYQISGQIRDEELKREEEVKAPNVLLDQEIASAKKSFNERAEKDAEARRKTQESIAELEAAKETFCSGLDKILDDTTVEALPVGIAGNRETGPK
jgi:predicted GTPase